MLPGGGPSPFDPLVEALEGQLREPFDVGAHEQVAEPTLDDVGATHGEVHHLVQHVHQRGELLPVRQNVGHVAADHDVGAERTCVGGREIPRHGAVHQEAVVELEGLQRSGDADGRPHHLREDAARERHGLAGLDVGSDGREPPGERPEVTDGRRGPCRLLHEPDDVRSDGGAGGKGYASPFQRKVEDRALPEPALVEESSTSLGGVPEGHRPVHGSDDRTDGVGAQSHGVEPPDDAAHARARDDVHLHSRVLEHLQHANMGEALRASAAEGQPDPHGVHALDAEASGSAGVG